jgi:hypothetical protein
MAPIKARAPKFVVLKMAIAITSSEDLPIRDASQWERADLR